MQSPPVAAAPVHRLATLAFVLAVLAGLLALYGSFLAETHLAGSPLNVARGQDGLAITRTSSAARLGIQLGAFVLPMILGIGAGLLGGEAMRAIAKSQGAYAGSLWAVFATMIGGLAAVVAGCMCVAVFVWKFVPAVYTS